MGAVFIKDASLSTLLRLALGWIGIKPELIRELLVAVTTTSLRGFNNTGNIITLLQSVIITWFAAMYPMLYGAYYVVVGLLAFRKFVKRN